MRKAQRTSHLPLPWRAARGAALLALPLALLLAALHGLWVDEAFSLAMAGGHSLEQAPGSAGPLDWQDAQARPAGDWAGWADPREGDWRAIPSAVRRSDTSPPLYYLLLHAWCRAWGASDMALRLFSLAAWALAWALLEAHLLRSGARTAQAWGLGTLALAPCGLWFASEGRMYALASLALAAAAVSAPRAERRDWRGPWAWAFAAAGAAAAWTHYFFIPAFAAVGIAAAASAGRQRWRPLAWTGLGVCSLLPWLSGAAAQSWRLTQGWLDGRPAPLALLLSPARLAWQLLSGRAAWSDPLAPLWNGASALVLAALLLSLWGLWRTRKERQRAWMLWALAGLCTPAAADLLVGTHCSDYPRYAFAAFIPLALLLGQGLAGLEQPWRLGAAALLLSGWAWGATQCALQPGRMNLPLREAARRLPAFQPGDGVVVQSIPSGVIALSRYLDPELPVLALNNRLSPEPQSALRAFCAGRPRVSLLAFHLVGGSAPAYTVLKETGREAAGFELASVRYAGFLPPPGRWAFPSPAPKAR